MNKDHVIVTVYIVMLVLFFYSAARVDAHRNSGVCALEATITQLEQNVTQLKTELELYRAKEK